MAPSLGLCFGLFGSNAMTMYLTMSNGMNSSQKMSFGNNALFMAKLVEKLPQGSN